jgi:predicted metal-dependent hydrolase
VRVERLAVRPMRGKWASCSTNGTVSFSTEVLDLPLRLPEYVVVHELLHLAVPNHGRLWKRLMRAHVGEYERFDAELRSWSAGPSRQPR